MELIDEFYYDLIRCHKTDAHTVLAAGGINAALGNLDKEDSWEQHFIDTYLRRLWNWGSFKDRNNG